ncbi:MAG: GtrA family protein [bacterium]|nr:GtrA family protein [bacterium]
MIRKLIALAHTILIEHKYLHFFVTGTSGVALNLFVTWFLTTFVFGLQNYFKAYAIALAVNLVYNFVLHTKVTFGTTGGHGRRFIWFAMYSLAMTALQAYIVRTVTPLVGLEYYLFVIAATIAVFSCVTFVFFKFFLFREHRKDEAGGSSTTR